MSFYPHNVDHVLPVQPSGGGKAITGARVADLLKYERAPLATTATGLHANVTLDVTYAKTAAATVVLETAVATNVLLTVTVGTVIAVDDILKDAAKAEWVRVTSIAAAPVYTVTRGFRGTAIGTHAAGATWNSVGKTHALTLLATELKACPQLLEVKGAMAGATNLTGDVTLYGTDIADTAISDTIALNDAGAVAGVKAFKTVTSVDFPCAVTAADTVSLGVTKSVGLPWKVLRTAHALVRELNASTDTGTVTYNTNLAKCIYTPSGSPNGTNLLTLYVVV